MIDRYEIRLGHDETKPHLRLRVHGYAYPDRAEPDGLDLLRCDADVHADPVRAAFPLQIVVNDLLELRDYLAEINSGNGPQRAFSFAGGLLNIDFAPSRRGPVLCAVRVKSIEASHVRVEYLITLEPESITRSLQELGAVETP